MRSYPNDFRITLAVMAITACGSQSKFRKIIEIVIGIHTYMRACAKIHSVLATMALMDMLEAKYKHGGSKSDHELSFVQ